MITNFTGLHPALRYLYGTAITWVPHYRMRFVAAVSCGGHPMWGVASCVVWGSPNVRCGLLCCVGVNEAWTCCVV